MAMFELEELKQKSLAVKLGIPAVYGGADVNRSKLLDGVTDPEPVDPRFLRNLCRVLQDMQDEIDNKVNRDW
jgi:hypothetical protein